VWYNGLPLPARLRGGKVWGRRLDEIRRFGARRARNRPRSGPQDICQQDLIERTPEIVEPWLAEGIPIGRAGLPVDIANAALWLASSESSFVTGHALVVDGGFTPGIPWSKRLDDMIS
jgi:NAD(P)-dependent dehydrogenase (short-subunit alcohol dehydrogenase family)